VTLRPNDTPLVISRHNRLLLPALTAQQQQQTPDTQGGDDVWGALVEDVFGGGAGAGAGAAPPAAVAPFSGRLPRVAGCEGAACDATALAVRLLVSAPWPALCGSCKGWR
jgi:hypothetical protein